MWLVGGSYEYGFHVWLVGVVVRRYIVILTIIINFPTPLVLAIFFDNGIPTSLFIFKMFFRSFSFTSFKLHLDHVISP